MPSLFKRIAARAETHANGLIGRGLLARQAALALASVAALRGRAGAATRSRRRFLTFSGSRRVAGAFRRR